MRTKSSSGAMRLDLPETAAAILAILPERLTPRKPIGWLDYRWIKIASTPDFRRLGIPS
jgi:hypothetical protein